VRVTRDISLTPRRKYSCVENRDAAGKKVMPAGLIALGKPNTAKSHAHLKA
jgi:hypothetical protein